MNECDILGGVKTYSVPSEIFSGGQDPTLRIYAPAGSCGRRGGSGACSAPQTSGKCCSSACQLSKLIQPVRQSQMLLLNGRVAGLVMGRKKNLARRNCNVTTANNDWFRLRHSSDDVIRSVFITCLCRLLNRIQQTSSLIAWHGYTVCD